MIWFSLLIPVIVSAILLWKFAHKTVWWEFLIPFGASILFIFIFKCIGEISQVTDTEYWTGAGMEARYYEDWNEYIHKTCSREVCSGSGKSRSCTTHYYDCSYVRYHSEYWEIDESNGIRLRISQGKFHELTKRWKNRTFVDMRRNYHTDDGDMYKTSWDKTEETMEVLTTTHSYENRVAATNNTYQFIKVKPEEAKKQGLWGYPPIYQNHYQPSILGVKYDHPASVKLSRLNAYLGRKKQVKVFILLYKGKDLQTSLLQEQFWKGGNKNELVVTIGIDSEEEVQWARSFSWSDKESAKVYSRELVLEQQGKPLDMEKIVDGLYPIVEKHFVRKQFKDFSYIEVQPTTFQIILSFILTLAVNIGVACFVIKNEVTEKSRAREKAWNKRYKR